ncbi:MAG: sigma-70 family RNA polymerase sigma factor [Planctomycetota bacterium]|nr:sigma-70 family RNA polymerase sigma factor [Planctomycetota bacterium]
MVEDPDRELVRLLVEGAPTERERALSELFRRHHQRVVTVAYRVLGSWQAAEDVAQEVFVRLARGARGFRGDASFRSWVYRVTVNRAIDARRREARRPAVRLPDGPVLPDDQPRFGPTPPPAPATPLVDDERAQAVQDALMRLSPKLRAVAVLRYVEGLSYEELAQVLDCSMGTIKSRLNRAHAALSRELGDQGALGGPGEAS